MTKLNKESLDILEKKQIDMIHVLSNPNGLMILQNYIKGADESVEEDDDVYDF